MMIGPLICLGITLLFGALLIYSGVLRSLAKIMLANEQVTSIILLGLLILVFIFFLLDKYNQKRKKNKNGDKEA